MNLIRESLENIKATEELKQNTLQYLREKQHGGGHGTHHGHDN